MPGTAEPYQQCPLCGEEVSEDNCLVKCAGCKEQGCQRCMYYNNELEEWFHCTSGPDDLAVGRETSECMADHLGVHQVIIFQKGANK